MELGILHSIIGEVWKPIKDFPNYVVSNRGRVYSFAREEIYCGVIRMRHGRFLVPRLGKQGYLYVALCKEGHTSTKKIHRLVAEASRNSASSMAGICSCCRGSRNSDNGFIWKYKKAS